MRGDRPPPAETLLSKGVADDKHFFRWRQLEVPVSKASVRGLDSYS